MAKMRNKSEVWLGDLDSKSPSLSSKIRGFPSAWTGLCHNPVKGTSTVAIVFSGYTRASFGVSFYGKKRTLKSIGTADSSTLMPLSADRNEIDRVDVGHRRRELGRAASRERVGEKG